jgi:sec-independent protein translocase protein TatB
MFDITSSKLLILAIVALIVVGPKDLPILLRTVGKYLGVIRRQAAEFRHQFDEAMREAELDQLKKEFDSVSREVRATVESGARSIEAQVEAASVKEEAAKTEAASPSIAAPQISTPPADQAVDTVPKPDAHQGHEPQSEEPGRGAA